MKKKIYVFDEYISSQKNGIGSYLRELLYCMKQMDVDICVLIFVMEDGSHPRSHQLVCQ